MNSSSSAPLSPIENSSSSSRERWELPHHIHFASDEATESSHVDEILPYLVRTKIDEGEEKKENHHHNEHRIETVRMRMMKSSKTTSSSITLRKTNNSDMMEPSEFSKFSDRTSFEIPHCIAKDLQDPNDQRDTSFQTQETAPESDSEEEEEGMGSRSFISNQEDSCICIANEEGSYSCVATKDIGDSCSSASSSLRDSEDDTGSCICIPSEEESCFCVAHEDTEDSCSSASSSMCSKPSVRFADEVGLPIQSIVRYECDRRQREHSELLVLCICPEKKTFEFLHVGYHRHQESEASVEDLLRGLPGMCTNPVFVEATFVALYRNNGVDKTFENLCLPKANQTGSTKNEAISNSSSERKPLPLQDCGLRENEVVVAAIQGSSERAVLQGIGPLLSNQKILKTLKRHRRSRRGLKFLGGNTDKEHQYHLKKTRDLSLRRRKTKKEGSDEKHPNAVQTVDTDFVELVDEYCHDYDPLYDVAEYHKKLLFGILAIGSGTIVFSALGL